MAASFADEVVRIADLAGLMQLTNGKVPALWTPQWHCLSLPCKTPGGSSGPEHLHGISGVQVRHDDS